MAKKYIHYWLGGLKRLTKFHYHWTGGYKSAWYRVWIRVSEHGGKARRERERETAQRSASFVIVVSFLLSFSTPRSAIASSSSYNSLLWSFCRWRIGFGASPCVYLQIFFLSNFFSQYPFCSFLSSRCFLVLDIVLSSSELCVDTSSFPSVIVLNFADYSPAPSFTGRRKNLNPEAAGCFCPLVQRFWETLVIWWRAVSSLLLLLLVLCVLPCCDVQRAYYELYSGS